MVRALQACEADDDVARIVRLELEEVALVDHLLDQLSHVVGLVRIGRDQTVERGNGALRRIRARPHRRLVAIARRQEIHEPARLVHRLDVVVERQIGDAGAPGMRRRPSSSWVTVSWVTVLTTSGPVTNRYELSRTMKMKSVIAGEYTAPPAHGPMITLIWGMTPDASTLRWNTSA